MCIKLIKAVTEIILHINCCIGHFDNVIKQLVDASGMCLSRYWALGKFREHSRGWGCSWHNSYASFMLSTIPAYSLSWHLVLYILSDLGDLSNTIGLLSRTIQQYSPPSEWIMCELGVFPIFLENNLLKVDKILGLTFFKARNDFKGFKTAFSHLL